MKAIYVRVSSEEQAKHGYSIKEQIPMYRIKPRIDNVFEYIDEGITDEVLNRPQIKKLRQDVKDGLIEQIICYDRDRLSRMLMNQLVIS
ncbi:recombinase family protein [Rossellomorea marisflavi]|uniref:Recombinase family protein n=1 Tax=Rossellomorea marisflavi TaxID=189381 RepID=A0A5D4RP84_9BACI|nr:recombinase family protein [Rossellomorea marisflavi]TYS53097.1 recombinase family protein [Rossellomorea marisflavi]